MVDRTVGWMGEHRLIDSVSSLSSLLTPFALGAAVGGIASQRVPVGNAAGDLVSSWTNPTSLVLAVSTSAYMAAVFLAGDAVRRDEPDLEGPFRRRALAVAGVGFLTVAESAWAHGVGVACLLGFVAVAFVTVAPAEPAAQPVDGSERCTPLAPTSDDALARSITKLAVLAGKAARPGLGPGVEVACAGSATHDSTRTEHLRAGMVRRAAPTFCGRAHRETTAFHATAAD